MKLATLFVAPRVEEILPGLAAEIWEVRQDRAAPALHVQIPVALGLVMASGLFCGSAVAYSSDTTFVGILGAVLGLVSIVLSWLPLRWWAQPLVLIGATSCRLMIGWAFEAVNLTSVMIAVENTPRLHNMFVCTLCSCYPTDVLGLLFYRTAFGEVDTGLQDIGIGSAIAVLMFGLLVTVSTLGAVFLRRREVEVG